MCSLWVRDRDRCRGVRELTSYHRTESPKVKSGLSRLGRTWRAEGIRPSCPAEEEREREREKRERERERERESD